MYMYIFFRLYEGKTIGLESSLSKQPNKPNFIVFQINAKVIYTNWWIESNKKSKKNPLINNNFLFKNF